MMMMMMMMFVTSKVVPLVIFTSYYVLWDQITATAWLMSSSQKQSYNNRRYYVSKCIKTIPTTTTTTTTRRSSTTLLYTKAKKNNDDSFNEEWSDFDDLGYGRNDVDRRSNSNSSNSSNNDMIDTNKPTYVPQKDDVVDSSTQSAMSTIDFAKLLQEKQQQQPQPQGGTTQPKMTTTGSASSSTNNNNNNNILYTDYTAIQTRQFSLGQDIVLSDYVGTMGFQEVTDWEYYYPEEENDDDDDDDDNGSNLKTKKNRNEPTRREVVQPNPFDSSKPRRTRTNSGSIVRIFRGEFVGTVGGTLSSQGLDRRVLIKEFSDTDLALSLMKSELQSIGRLQSNLLFPSMDTAAASSNGIDWIRTAMARQSFDLRKDTANVVSLMKALANAPYVGILGEVNLSELDGNMEPNEFYRAMGVVPPQPGAVWVVYEYVGLSTVQAYSSPAELRLAKLPLKKGFFGNVIIPQAPSWNERANYIVKGIMKSTIAALAIVHENGMIHGSIGRASIILSSKDMDKTSAMSPMNTMISKLRVKLSDFSFAKAFEQSTYNEEFCIRAKAFGLNFKTGDNNILTTNFAIAEDMHALGFVFLGLLLTTLAELPKPVSSTYQMPATDEDTLQRLLGDIFDKDMKQFREFVLEEDIWSNLVTLLDDNDKAGWRVLETLVLAREKAAKNKDTDQLFTIRGLLSTPFFQ